MGIVSDELGEVPLGHFRNGKEVQWKWSPKMLADCSWSLTKETPTGTYKRQKKKKCVFYDEFVCS
jgi:hypothetical protein